MILIPFLTLTFLLSIIPLRDYDLWFHLRSGEVIAKMGIIHYDVFSHSAVGREWFPYEWLFQIIVYQFQEFFGFESIKYLMAAVITLQISVLYLILRRVFNLNKIFSLISCFLFFASVYDFYSARPHVFAYTFLLINLGLILLFFFKKKNYLLLTFPITLIWANLHGSVFLSVAFFAAFSVISFLNFLILKEKTWLSKSKTLAFYTIPTALLTILPPLGFLQYRLLWIFFTKNAFISKFIDEWSPLAININPFGFIIYSVTVVIILLPFLLINIKQKSFKENLWALPLIPLIFLAYSASRNIFLGYISMILILGWSLSKLKFKSLSNYKNILLTILFIIVIGLHGWVLSLKQEPQKLYYPVKTAEFLKTHKVNGNMFNDYGYGGYLIYQLWPEYKVFFDGRTDVYLCCEMPDTLELATKKYQLDTEYKKLLDKLWDKYKISFIIIRTGKHNVLRKITRILSGDPNWNLIFWDDYTQLFVKKDGKNDEIIKEFGTKAATPYDKNPYRKGLMDQAFFEYQRVIKVGGDSTKSRNTLGFILLQKGKFEEAKTEFEKATQIDPSNESPYMNLGELSAKDKDYEQAISLYKKALSLAPDRGLIYIRLGQLYLAGFNDTETAKKAWSSGLKNTVDEDARKELQNLLSKI